MRSRSWSMDMNGEESFVEEGLGFPKMSVDFGLAMGVPMGSAPLYMIGMSARL